MPTYREGVALQPPTRELICLACGVEPVATGENSNRRLCRKCIRSRKRKPRGKPPTDLPIYCVECGREPVKRRGRRCRTCRGWLRDEIVRLYEEVGYQQRLTKDRGRHQSAEELYGDGDQRVQPRDRGRWCRKGYAAHKPKDWRTLPEDCRHGHDHDAGPMDHDDIREAWEATGRTGTTEDPVITLTNARRRLAGKDSLQVDLDTPRAVHVVIDIGCPPVIGWSPAIEPTDPGEIEALRRHPSRCRVCRGEPLVSRHGAVGVCLACLRSGVDHILKSSTNKQEPRCANSRP